MKMANNRAASNESSVCDISIRDVANRSNFEEALEHLNNKKDSCGSDGMFLSELGSYWKVNGNKLLRSLLDGTYTPGVVKAFNIVNAKGKNRSLALFNSVDRLVFRALQQKLQPVFDELLSSHCYAFRFEYGVDRAIADACDYIENGGIWMVKLDIEHFFDEIPLSVMESMLARKLHDQKLMTLIQKLLRIKVDDGGRIRRKQKGIIQGSPISPLFSNYYLTELDNEIDERGWRYIRYADDITLFFTDCDEAEIAYEFVAKELHERFSLKINKEKSGIYKSLGQQYLGFNFIKDSKTHHVTAVRKQRSAIAPLYGWYKDSINRIDRNYHIINDGVLTRRDYTILFDNEEGKKYIPVETTDSLTIYSDVTFTADFLRFMNGHRINVTIVDKYGTPVGSFCGSRTQSQGKVMLKQAAIYLDESRRLSLSKSLKSAYVQNVFVNIEYYARRTGNKTLSDALESKKTFQDEVNGAVGIEKLMLTEARMRQLYYSLFNEIIHDHDFHFRQRTKRPPKDALNAMISFGNTLLYNRIATEIYKTSLDIRVGIIHSSNNRSQTLNLDIADLFKPLIVDRTIFRLINRNMLDISRDFRQIENRGIYLSETGKRIFINEFNQKLFQKTTNKGASKTYASIIREEVLKLYRYYMFDEKYRPYRYH